MLSLCGSLQSRLSDIEAIADAHREVEKQIPDIDIMGAYGLTISPDRWHRLIREAIAIKCRKPDREYDSQAMRLNDLVELLAMIHAESNRVFQDSQGEKSGVGIIDAEQ